MFNNLKDFLPDVKMDSPPTPPASPPSRPSLNIKEKKKPAKKTKDIFLYSNNKMESNSTDNVKIVSAETIEKEAKQEAEAKPVEVSKEPEPEPTSPKRRLGDRGRDKKVRKKRYPNGMPEARKAQLALARKKALRVRKERALQRKAEKKRDQNARYNKPAPPAPKPPAPQRQASQPIPIPQTKPQHRPSKAEAAEAFFGLMDQWDNRRQARKKKRKEAEAAARPKPTPKPSAPSIYGNRNNNNMNWDSLFF